MSGEPWIGEPVAAADPGARVEARRPDGAEGRRTVWVALTANATVAGAKLTAAAVTGSAAMLAESAHSLADILNEVFLLVALRTSRRPPSGRHPFGYGKERFFWSLLAAVSIFVTGAVLAVSEGVRALMATSHQVTNLPLAFGVLAVAFLADGVSARQAFKHLRSDADASGRSAVAQLRDGSDPTARTVLLEDGAALVGVALAAVGLGLHRWTGSGAWDAMASIAVGVLLAGVALGIGAQSRRFLLGAGASTEEQVQIESLLAAAPEVDAVIEVLTMRTGADSLLVAARVHFRSDLNADDVEALADRLDSELRDRVPQVTQVFIDPTSR